MLDRTWYSTLHNDTGLGQDGSLWRKEDVDSLMDAVDAELARLDADDATTDADLVALQAEIARLDAADAALASDIDALDAPTIARTNVANVFTEPQTIEGDPPELILHRPGSPAKGRLLMPADGSIGLTWNAEFENGLWQRDDAAQPALSLAINRAQELVFVRGFPDGAGVDAKVPLLRIGTQGQIYERARTTAMGKWVPVPFNPADFSTGIAGTTWTVTADAYQLQRYALVGETMLWRIILGYSGGTCDVTGDPSPHLLIMPPAGFTMIQGQAVRLPLADVGGVRNVPVILDTLLPPYFRLNRADFLPFTGRINLMGGVTFEIEPEVLPVIPTTFPLSIYRGDTGRWTFRLWHDANKTVPVDLTGVQSKAEIRNQPSGGTVVPMNCLVSFINHVDVWIEPADSRNVPSRGAWDLQLTFPSGDVLSPVAGPVVATLDVTDSTLATITRTDVVVTGAPVRVRGF